MDDRPRPEPASFRDPSGFVFWHDGTLYRQVNSTFAEEYRRFVDSGLYEELASEGLLVAHEEVGLRPLDAPPAAAVIKPQRVPFVSYPYEWCFSQLKSAALLTLEVQRRALNRGMVLRDASAYNVQFVGCRPVFIDTLSFGSHHEGRPWVAYRQFCQHFLGPLALSAWADPALAQLSRVQIDGVSLDVVGRILPMRTWLRPGMLIHLHLHGRAGATTTKEVRTGTTGRMTINALLGVVDSLRRTVEGLNWEPPHTRWSEYSAEWNYSEAAHQEKRRLVAEFLGLAGIAAPLEIVWDVGANTGEYSRIAAEGAVHVVSFDVDGAVVERHFRKCREQRCGNVLPLVQDLANPSGPIGWHHEERQSLVQRGPADAVLALAVVHHLAFGSNVPLPAIARFFRDISRQLIIEFVPKEDSQVQGMLAMREDVFAGYSRSAFEEAFGRHFVTIRCESIAGTARTLYLMRRA